MNHPTDDLEACALGSLDAERRIAIDAHVARCRTCATRLSEAEATVARMLDIELGDDARRHASVEDVDRGLARLNASLRSLAPLPPAAASARSRALPLAAGLATAFALATGALGILDVRREAALRDDGAMLHDMIASHFVHAQFRSLVGAALEAKVVYDRQGRWYDVIAFGIDPADRIAIVARDGRTTERPERFVRRGEALALRLPALGPIAGLELRDADGRVVGRAPVPTGGGR